MNDLSEKSLVITGAGSGIGRATSLLAASQGASLVLVDARESVNETADQITAGGGRAIAVEADISDGNQVAAFIRAATDKWGGLDGLFANAGIGGSRLPFDQMTRDDLENTLRVNTVGTFLCVQSAARVMVGQGHGSILCTASVGGLRANAGGVDYSASKAAVISMAQTIAYQLYGTGVRINAICPGLVETGMTREVFDAARARGREDRIGQVNPAARPGKPDEIAQMACFLLSDAASYVNGQAIAVDGGLSSSHPWVFPRK